MPINGTFRIGPWSYSRRTGQSSLKLPRGLRWQSKTRTQRTKAKKAKTDQRAAERQRWTAQLDAGQVEGVAVPRDIQADRPGITYQGHDGRTTTRKATAKRPTKAAPPGPLVGGSPTPAQLQAELRGNGLCGALTRDGRHCLNPRGSCPHHR